MKKICCLVVVASLLPLLAKTQINVGGFMKDKAGELKDKLKDKAKEKTNDLLEKQRKEYDESNFNYAISFLDNSGVFEAKEKGNGFASNILSGAKFLEKDEKTTEERAYSNLKNGELLMAGNNYYLAEQAFKLAKLLYEDAGKTSDANYGQTISNLALLYQSRGRFNKAASFNQQALKFREQADNKGMLIVSINNDAVLKKETGFYTEAEAGFKKALEMAKTQNNNMAQALINNNMAMTYLDMNKIKESESYLNTSISQAAKELKENSPNFIKLQINQANLFRIQKKYTQAEEIYLKAISIKDKKLGAHPDLAHLKRGLAQVYMEMGRYAEVEKLLLSAVEIDRQKLGENNPATLAVQQELANFYRFNNNSIKSLELISLVVKKKKDIYGENHPNYIQALEDLALSQSLNNQMAECKANYKIVIDNTLNYINTFFNSLNDNEKTQYWEKTNARLQRYYSFLRTASKTDKEALRQFYSSVINTKGFLLSNSSKIRYAIFSGNDESLKIAYNQWLETKEQLNMAFQLSKEEQAQEKINQDSLKRRADELERELSQKSALFRENISNKPVSLESIQKQLKPNECVVEIEELSEYNNGFTGKENYVALVLTAGDLKLIDLGSGKAIEKAILDFRQKITQLKPENEAYTLTWKPIDLELKGITRVYLSLDGAYHQLSINALKDAAGKYIVDKYTIQLMTNTRDVLTLKQNETSSAKPSSAFLLGNPAYGKNELIEQLPGTEEEVKKISTLLSGLKVKTETVTGEKATEAKIKSINSPGILHIATHGYFLADVEQLETTRVLGVDISAAKENPLLRSGLLLAGCENVFDENFKPSFNSENGVLTAYEAATLNLDKTELVVLSACETGLGSVKQGEGVYGLQRAFLITGAKSVIMSLWSVSDNATMELMTLFYKNYATTGNRTQAFNDAIKQLKLKYKEPFYWSAFVMLNR